MLGVFFVPFLLAGLGRAAEAPAPKDSRLVVVLEGVRDPATGEVCGGVGELSIDLAERRLLSLVPAGGGPAVEGRVDGGPRRTLAAIPLEPGPHTLTLQADVLPDPLGDRDLEIELGGHPSSPPERRPVRARGDVVNRPVLPVGHVFLQGVNLFEGTIVRQATDLKLGGRHLALEVTRTYSSAGLALAGATGVRWAMNLGARLTPFEACGLYAVTQADGSTQTFRKRAGGGFAPQVGYHTALASRADGSFEFTDKSATRHHFAPPARAGSAGLPLRFIEEPHGDRIELLYDPRGRVREATEVHSAAAGVRLQVRSLLFTWTASGGHDRIESVEAPGLGLRVDYAYDSHGNLTSAIRFDSDNPGRAVERYAYSTDNPRDPHRLTMVTEPDGGRTEKRFGPDGRVKEVVTLPPKGGKTVTSFTYDRKGAREGVFRTTTQEGASRPVLYVMNDRGNPLRIEETDAKGRRVFEQEWARDDVYKIVEWDNRGYRAQYTYDAHGNLATARTRTGPGAAETVVRYEYDQRFNKLVRKVDEKGAIGVWRLDPRTGDLVEARPSDGPPATHGYDSAGNLRESVADGRRTGYSDHDTYGNATKVVLPSGKVQIREFDRRGRRYADPDEPEKPAPPDEGGS